jgi:CRISPR-associated protein Csy3
VNAQDQVWDFNSHDYSLREFDQDDAMLASLSALIEKGLRGRNG